MDPKLKEECIVLGAHADHVGRIGSLLFPGANDNASGTAVMMEVAEAFAEMGVRPRRSILFMAFAGEEMGLLGSRYYTEHPLFPLEKTRGMINMDMVGLGANRRVLIIGGTRYPALADVIEAVSEEHRYFQIDRWEMTRNSDHYPFHEKGVPSVFLYSTGSASNMHTSRDLPEACDPEYMERMGRMIFWVLWDLANGDAIEMSHADTRD